MTQQSEWHQFFDGYAPVYMEEVFTKNTLAEVDFVREVLEVPPGGRILDVGCGTGRHSVELAKRGYRVTGVDLSSGMLDEALKAAEAAGVRIELIHSNAADFTSEHTFDGAICLCEGAFCLLGADDDPSGRDLAILRNVFAVLKPSAGFMLTALNASRKIREATPQDIESGVFDPVTMTSTTVMEYDTPEGKKSAALRERYYAATELAMLARLAGFDVQHVWGGTAGNWGRRPVDLDEMEIMLVARKGRG